MKILIGLIISVSVLINLLLIFQKYQEKPGSNSASPQNLSEKYPLLSSRILGEYDKDILIRFVELRSTLRSFINNEYGSDFSLYFEYLPTGVSVGVNEKTEFYTASLLKVPTVMAYYYNREKNNRQEDGEVIIKPHQISSEYGSLWKRGEGSKVDLSEAIKLTLTESDNTANRIIRDELEPGDTGAIYHGLDLDIKLDEGNLQLYTSVKTYSSIFKSLYFSSLLSKDNSHHILELLTQSIFKDKLPAGIPENIPIAHKIGVYDTPEGKDVYSDCGIVYYPRRNYLICMASFSDENTARERMKTVSRIIYDFISSQ